MKLLFIISSVGHGKGGHFFDLNTIANALGNSHEVYVVNIGKTKSVVFDDIQFTSEFVPFNGWNFFSVLSNIKSISEKFKPDAVTAFDVPSFSFSRLISKRYKQQNFLTKCGGPNPRRYFPLMDNLVVVSRENYYYFKNKKRYNQSELFIIAARVNQVEIDYKRVYEFKKTHELSDITILRINRIGKHYLETMKQCVNLLEWILANKMSAKLVILGAKQNADTLTSILNYIRNKKLEENVIIETDDYFTANASELIEIADLVVGTGRNFMEASSLDKVVLVPHKNDKYPLYVTNDNFEEVFKSNLSPRTEVSHFSITDNLEQILLSCNGKIEQNSHDWFKNYFDVNTGAAQYTSMFESQKERKRFRFFDTLTNCIYAIKTFIQAD